MKRGYDYGPFHIQAELERIDIQVGHGTIARVIARNGLAWPKRTRQETIYQRVEPRKLGEIAIDLKYYRAFQEPGESGSGTHGKPLNKGLGKEYLFMAIEQKSRLAYARVYTRMTADNAQAFLRDATAYYASVGITSRSVKTDNGKCFTAKLFESTCSELMLKHDRIRPARPQDNGKAERVIRTFNEIWGSLPYPNSETRNDNLPNQLNYYNLQRRHRSLGGLTPMESVNNLLGAYN